MIRFIILLAVSVLVFVTSCKKEAAVNHSPAEAPFSPSGHMADLVYNPVRTDGSIDSSFLPILTWKEDVYDFGKIYEGDVVTREYFFTNTGTAPLLILNATSTCGCTVPEWPKSPVPPDSTSSITVKFNSLNKVGTQSKEVTIFANTFPNSSKITIKGEVESTN